VLSIVIFFPVVVAIFLAVARRLPLAVGRWVWVGMNRPGFRAVFFL
jgi:hypothetical protein